MSSANRGSSSGEVGGGAPSHGQPRSGRYAALVAAGILLSRLAGLVRERIFSHYFGLSDAGDAWKAAFRIPNFLQNLFGEGVLSASFIPVYARLLAEGDEREANRVAGAIFSLLALVVSLAVLIGVLTAPWLVGAIAPGFTGEKRELALRLVRVIFPGTGLLVLSAWCLGVLNSHRRFFLSYAAPLGWNAVMIAVLVGFGRTMGQYDLAVATAWGSVIGSAAQFLVQLPVVLRLARGLDLGLRLGSEQVRTVLRNFGPAFVGRGVVQISAYIDSLLASFLSTGAVTALYNAQTIYLLPVSLFGMSISAAELPLMSGTTGDSEEVQRALRERLLAGLRRIAYFVIPSAVAFLLLGDVVTSVVYQSGRFSAADSRFVWVILGCASIGLLATTSARLYASTFYALRDTRTPLRFAAVRVGIGAILGYIAAFHLPRLLDVEARWGVAGLTTAASVVGWIEFLLLRRALTRRIGAPGLSVRELAPLWGAAVLAAVVASLSKLAFHRLELPVLLSGLVVLGLFGAVYLGSTLALGVAEARAIAGRFARRR
ncbi:MAG: murein biosynthesis integral membrane protein MurJ [Candidatus Eisenbacteria bacterium]